ncbi:MAG: translation elongation factor Ts [Acidimicrobiales bacterium]
MPNFTAKDVQKLRQATDAGMMDAKRALEANEGDMERAAQWLREKGLAKVAKLSDRENSQGTVAVAFNASAAALVELKSETDFAAKADDFVALVQRLAELVLAGGEAAVAEGQAEIDSLKIAKRENIELGKVARVEAGDNGKIDTYLHRQDGRGVIGVIIEATGVDQDTLHELALHCAFAKPQFLTRDEVPAAAVEKERNNLLDITKAEGKPEAAWPKIVEGRVNAWLAGQVLLEQGVHGDKETVSQRIGNGTINRFVLAVIGS